MQRPIPIYASSATRRRRPGWGRRRRRRPGPRRPGLLSTLIAATALLALLAERAIA